MFEKILFCSSLHLVGSAQSILFLEMLKFSKNNLLKEIFLWGTMKKLLKYFGMFYFSNWEFSKLINYSTDVCWSCQGTSPYASIYKAQSWNSERGGQKGCKSTRGMLSRLQWSGSVSERCPIHEDKCPIQGAMQDQNSTCVIMYIVQAQDEGDGLILCSSVNVMSALIFVTIKKFLWSSLGFNLIEICWT
jgi:hypothetical protein